MFADLGEMTPLAGANGGHPPKQRRPGDATPAAFSNPWRPEEDEALVAAIKTHGMSWKKVEKDLRPYARTVAMCRNRYARMMAPLRGGIQAKGRNRCKICNQIKRGHTCTGEAGVAATHNAVSLVLKGLPFDTLALKQPIEYPAIDDPAPAHHDGHPILPMATAEGYEDGYKPTPGVHPLSELDLDEDELDAFLGDEARRREWDAVAPTDVKPDTPNGMPPTPAKERGGDSSASSEADVAEMAEREAGVPLLAPPPLGHGRSFFKSSFDMNARLAFAPTATKQASTCLLVGDVLDMRPSSPPPAIPSLEDCQSPPSFSQDF